MIKKIEESKAVVKTFLYVLRYPKLSVSKLANKRVIAQCTLSSQLDMLVKIGFLKKNMNKPRNFFPQWDKITQFFVGKINEQIGIATGKKSVIKLTKAEFETLRELIKNFFALLAGIHPNDDEMYDIIYVVIEDNILGLTERIMDGLVMAKYKYRNKPDIKKLRRIIDKIEGSGGNTLNSFEWSLCLKYGK